MFLSEKSLILSRERGLTPLKFRKYGVNCIYGMDKHKFQKVLDIVRLHYKSTGKIMTQSEYNTLDERPLHYKTLNRNGYTWDSIISKAIMKKYRGKTIVICLSCNKSFQKASYEMKRTGKNFCSKECYSRYRKND